MSRQAIKNLVGQVIREHLSYELTKDLHAVNGHKKELDEEHVAIATGAMQSSSIFEGGDSTAYGEFRGERVKLNSPYKGTDRDYMAYVRQEGRVIRVHFDARGNDN